MGGESGCMVASASKRWKALQIRPAKFHVWKTFEIWTDLISPQVYFDLFLTNKMMRWENSFSLNLKFQEIIILLFKKQNSLSPKFTWNICSFLIAFFHICFFSIYCSFRICIEMFLADNSFPYEQLMEGGGGWCLCYRARKV